MRTLIRRLLGRLTRWAAPDLADALTEPQQLRREVNALQKRLGGQTGQRAPDPDRLSSLVRNDARQDEQLDALRQELSLLRRQLSAHGVQLATGFADVTPDGVTCRWPVAVPDQEQDPRETPLDVEFSGRRVWSFVPARDGRAVAQGGVLVRWPGQLRPYLDGAAEVVVRPSAGGPALFAGTVAFGTGDGVVDLRDSLGRPLTVDKGNRVTAMFDQTDPATKEAVVRATEEAVQFLSAQGSPAFLAFGNLLGAVRDGQLIGHDNDADISYLAKATDPVDIMLESLELERVCQRAGWRTLRMSGADFKLMVKLPNGGSMGIDVFTAFYLSGRLWVMPNVLSDLPPSALLPQSTVELEGQQVTAPADPEALLEATYGPGWRTPDPAFKYAPSLHVRQTLNGFMRGERRHLRYWTEFYADPSKNPPTERSAFAEWVAKSGPLPGSLVDVGCGNGRDSLWFAEQGVSVVGCDFAASAIAAAQETGRRQGSSATFRRVNLYDLRSVLTLPALLAHDQPTDAVYARFLVHALEDDGRVNLWRFSRSLLRGSGGRLFCEFRTKPAKYVFGRHFRNLVAPSTVTEELGSYGFTVEHMEEGQDLAVHQEENPQVCRIIARLER